MNQMFDTIMPTNGLNPKMGNRLLKSRDRIADAINWTQCIENQSKEKKIRIGKNQIGNRMKSEKANSIRQVV